MRKPGMHASHKCIMRVLNIDIYISYMSVEHEKLLEMVFSVHIVLRVFLSTTNGVLRVHES